VNPNENERPVGQDRICNKSGGLIVADVFLKRDI